MKFLKIPIQTAIAEEAHNRKGHILLRGAVGSGKTTTAILWAIEQMKKGNDVIYIVPREDMLSNAKRAFVQILSVFGIEIVLNSVNGVQLQNQSKICFATSSLSLVASLHSESCVVVDDIDCFYDSIKVKRRTRGYDYVFITGTETVLPDDTAKYFEINYIDMLACGLISQTDIDRLKSNVSHKTFKNYYGPWLKKENRDYKSALKCYNN